jgi:hypothetical protein
MSPIDADTTQSDVIKFIAEIAVTAKLAEERSVYTGIDAECFNNSLYFKTRICRGKWFY